MALLPWDSEDDNKDDLFQPQPIKKIASVQSSSWQPAASGADSAVATDDVTQSQPQQGGIFGQTSTRQPTQQSSTPYLVSQEKAQVDQAKRQRDAEIEQARIEQENARRRAEAAAAVAQRFKEGQVRDQQGQKLDVGALKNDNGWKKYYAETFANEKNGMGFWDKLMDGGQASKRAEVTARNKYATELINRAYDDNGNTIDQGAADYARKVTAYNKALAEDNSTRSRALGEAIGAFDKPGQNSLFSWNSLKNAINAEKQMNIGSAVFGVDDTQKTDWRDVGRFGGSLVQGFGTMPVIGAKELYEAGVGRGTDTKTGLQKDLSMSERLGRGASGGLNVVTPFVGGSGKLLNDLTAKVMTNMATAAEKSLLEQAIKRTLLAATEQAGIGAVQSGAEYFSNGDSLLDENGNFDKQKLAEFAKQVGEGGAMSFAGGAILGGAGEGVRAIRQNRVPTLDAGELAALETNATNSGEAQVSANRAANADGAALQALENGDVTPVQAPVADGIATPEAVPGEAATPVTPENATSQNIDLGSTKLDSNFWNPENAVAPADGVSQPTPTEVVPVRDAPTIDQAVPADTTPAASTAVPGEVTPATQPVADGVVQPANVAPVRDAPTVPTEEVRALQDSRAGKSQAEEAVINQKLQELEADKPQYSTPKSLQDDLVKFQRTGDPEQRLMLDSVITRAKELIGEGKSPRSAENEAIRELFDRLRLRPENYKTVDDFLAAQGSPLYHGTDTNFDRFSLSNFGRTDDGFAGKGAYFSGNKKNARQYGKNVVKAYSKVKNPLVVEDSYFFGALGKDKVRSALGLDGRATAKEVSEELVKRGYDGVQINERTSSGRLVKSQEMMIPDVNNIYTENSLRKMFDESRKPAPNTPEGAPVYRGDAGDNYTVKENKVRQEEQPQTQPSTQSQLEPIGNSSDSSGGIISRIKSNLTPLGKGGFVKVGKDSKGVEPTDPTAALEQEAKKYKSAEEFVKAQGEPLYHRSQNKFDKFDISKVSNASNRQNGGWGLYFSDSVDAIPEDAYGKYLYEVQAPKGTLLDTKNPVDEKIVSKIVNAVRGSGKNPSELSEFSYNGYLFYKTLSRVLGGDKEASLFLSKNGIDGLKKTISPTANDYILFSDKSIRTKQQLTDLYNQATKKRGLTPLKNNQGGFVKVGKEDALDVTPVKDVPPADNVPEMDAPTDGSLTPKQVAERLMPKLSDNKDVKQRIADAAGMGKDTASPIEDILRDGNVKPKTAARITKHFNDLEEQVQKYNSLTESNQKAYAEGGTENIDSDIGRERSRTAREMGTTTRRLMTEIKRMEGSRDHKVALINGLTDIIGTRNANVLTSAGLLERNIFQELTANAKLAAKNPIKMLRSTFGNGNIIGDTAKGELSHWKDAPRNPIEAAKYVIGNTYRTAMTPTTILANTRRGAIRDELTKWAFTELEGRNVSSSEAHKLAGTAGNEMEALVNTFTGVDNGMTNRKQAMDALKAWKEYIRTGDDGAKAEFLSKVEQHDSLADQMIAGLSKEDQVRARGLMALKNLIFPFVRTATNLAKNTVRQDLNPFARSLLDEIRVDQRSGGANAINWMKSKLVDYGIMGGVAALASSGTIVYNDGDEVDKPKGWSIKTGENSYMPVRSTSLELPVAMAGTAYRMATDISKGDARDAKYYAGMITGSLPYIDQFNQTTGAVDSLTNMNDEGGDKGYAAKSYAVNTIKSFVPGSNNGIQPYVAGKQGESLNAKTVYDKNFGTWLQNSIQKSYDPEFYNGLKDSRDNAGRVRTVDNQGVISHKKINDASTAEFNDRITDLVDYGRKNGLGKNTQDMFNTYDTGKNNNFKGIQDSITFLDVEQGGKPDNAKKLEKNPKLANLSEQIRSGFFDDTGDELLTLDGENLYSDVSVPNKAGSKNSRLPISMQSIKNAIAQTDLSPEARDRIKQISDQDSALYAQLKSKSITYDQYVAEKNKTGAEYTSILEGSKNYQKMLGLFDELDQTGFFKADGLGSTKAGQTYLWNSLNALLGSKGATPAATYPDGNKSFTPWGNRGTGRTSKSGGNLEGGKGVQFSPVTARQLAKVESAKFTPFKVKVKLGNEIKRDRSQNYSDRSF